MYLIVGLGNPGKKYMKTRHNVGFDLIDEFATNASVKFKKDKNLKSDVAVTNFCGKKIILMKPLTFMNLSGEAVSAAVNYYDINIENICVVYDDLDIDKGKIKLKQKGSSAGHNGIKSIISELKTQKFKRIKIGIKKDFDENTINYVLGRFSRYDRDMIDCAIENGISALELWLEEDFVVAMNNYNGE